MFVVATHPQQLRLTGRPGTSLTGAVVLSPAAHLGIEVTKTQTQRSLLTVQSIEAQGDGSDKITVEALPSELPGFFREILFVTVLASDGSEHQRQVPVVIEYLDRISVAPRGGIVFLRQHTQALKNPKGRSVRREVQIFATAPEVRFQIKKVELLDVPEGVFETEVRTIQEGERYGVTVFVRESREEPSIRGRLRITTDDPQVPERELRLYAQFGDRER